jgi:hypothetical protein
MLLALFSLRPPPQAYRNMIAAMEKWTDVLFIECKDRVGKVLGGVITKYRAVHVYTLGLSCHASTLSMHVHQ